MNRLDKTKRIMMDRHLKPRGISDPRVLTAMAAVPREAFVARDQFDLAYADIALPAGEDQTISQPYVVALMAMALHPGPEDRVLDVGSGTGYAAAVLSRMARQVYAIEYHETLAEQARERCRALDYSNIEFKVGDGSLGWPEQAPFDVIHVAACTPRLPTDLVDQLAPGGRLVIPVGDHRNMQHLVCLTRGQEGLDREDLGLVRFVPLLNTSGS